MRVVIVGTGPAGLTALRIATEKKCEVWLIDQGLHETPDYSPRNLGLREQCEITGGYGGTTRIWAGQLMPLSPRELLSGEFSSLFSKEEYNREIFQILKWFGVSRIKYLTLSLIVRITAPYDNPRFSLITKLINLENVFKREISINSERSLLRKVRSLEIADGKFRGLTFQNGEKFPIFPGDILVLAAGTMGNSRIMLESFPDLQDNEIGRNLSDHPCGYIGSLHPKYKYGLFRKPTSSFFSADKVKYKYEVLVSDSSGCFEIHPNKSSISMRKPIAVLNEIGLVRFVGETIVRFVNFAFSIFPFTPWVVSESADVWLQFEQSNNPRSCIEIFEGKFIYNWSLNEYDLMNFSELVNSIDKQISSGSKDFKKVAVLDVEDLNIWAQQANHPSGTISNTLVIEKFGIMKQYNQILVAGGAVFPRASWVNPTLTIMATTSLGLKSMLRKLS